MSPKLISSKPKTIDLKTWAGKVVLLLLLVNSHHVTRGAPFSNLAFDSGDTNGSQIAYSYFTNFQYPYGTGLAEKLLPGWTIVNQLGVTNLASIGNGFFEQATAPQVALNHAGLMVEGDYRSADVPPSFDLIGKFALILDNRNGLDTGGVQIEVQQRGDVPVDAHWMIWREYDDSLGLTIGINGNYFTLNYDDNTYRDPNDLKYGRRFDISPWAGQTIDLAIENGPGIQMYVIDNISFEVPEPGELVLILVALAGGALARGIRGLSWS